MPTFITLIVPDDAVDQVLAALPAPRVYTTTTLPEKKFGIGEAIWAGRYGLPAVSALIAQWHVSRAKKRKARKDVH